MIKQSNGWRWVRVLVAVFGVFSSALASAETDVKEHKLANGLKVVVLADHRAPVVVSQLWYRVGSMDEVNGSTGLSHALEHMMFKGTKKVPAGEFARRVAAAGGRDNAFTTRDFTVYFQQLHKSKLELALSLEADRMQNLQLKRDDFSKEIEVIKEERRWRTDDEPWGVLREQHQAALWRSHPYRVPVIGWMSDLQSMQIDDLRDWYATWYAPNNAVLVVVGDVEAKDVFDLAQRYFGNIPAKVIPDRKPQQEPEPKGVQHVQVKAPSELSLMLMGYQVPKLDKIEPSSDALALEVLVGALDGHAAARLERALVRDLGWAHSINVDYDGGGRGPGQLTVALTLRPGVKPALLERAVRTELRALAEELLPEDELKRVKTQVLAHEVYGRDSMFAQAMQIGQFEMTGRSAKDLDAWLEAVKAVRAEDVQRVVKQYLSDDTRLTVTVLDPQPLQAHAPARKPEGLRHD